MHKIIVISCAALLMGSVAAFASTLNEPPPSGAILDLNGLPIPSTAQLYTVNFTGALATTDITFAFRDDPSWISFSDASLVDLTTSSGNLLLNGNFALGTVGSNNVTDWTYVNTYGASSGGSLNTGCGYNGSNCWFDGAVGAYDAISQTVATNIGDQYQISFYLSEDSGNATFLATDPTEASAIDALAYAQAGVPAAATPEPSSMALLGTGLLALLWSMRRRLVRG